MPNKEFNIVMLHKLSRLQRGIDRPLSKIWKTIWTQNEKFNTEMEPFRRTKQKFWN